MPSIRRTTSSRVPNSSRPVVIYDFDHYYMGSCLAELLRGRGHEVTIVTPAAAVSAWTFMNNELTYVRERMSELGIGIVPRAFRDGVAPR